MLFLVPTSYPRALQCTENFLFGKPGSADEEKIFLVDFGLSNK